MEKLFGTHSERELKRIYPIADKVMGYEQDFKNVSDEELRGKTAEFKQRLSAGETLDDLLPEAFAVVREAAWRVLGLRPYRVQVIGGIVIHQGRVAEMRTGEGKTLVATMPAYLNALTGNGVHVVTANDYLAKRDSEWMGKVYRFLGMSVGLVTQSHGMMDIAKRKDAYAADITYGTNNEMGFDYLRDNMAVSKEGVVQRGHAFAIVDEVDSILIDEARTPLIISGPGQKSTELYEKAEDFVSRLKSKRYATIEDKEYDETEDAAYDYIINEKAKAATLTQTGIRRAEKYFGVENLSDVENTELYHHINQALKANGIMKRDVDYVVKDGEVLIVDEFTGRVMEGRRYNEGLHQAIEAKEHVLVQKESQTMATITFQNYFRLYGKMSGMTGTALTEETEFREIYKMDVIVIPTNKPIARMDHPDIVYATVNAKYKAVVEKVKECYKKGQPVLVGTVSIDKSEILSEMLRKECIPHNVLNAKNHEREAEIVAQAGKFGAVTIATNMAGRGTDIILGGNAEFLAKKELQKAGYDDEVIAEALGHAESQDETVNEARALFNRKKAMFQEEVATEAEKVRDAGGLYIIGTERHESRRIDNQLRGRSGRQGDPGESTFYLSLEDDILRLFGSDSVKNLMTSMVGDDMAEEIPLEFKMLSKSIEHAQQSVESQHFQARKTVIEFDDVLNEQRNLIYKERNRVLNGEDVSQSIIGMVKEYVSNTITGYEAENGPITTKKAFAEAAEPLSKLFLSEGYPDTLSDAELASGEATEEIIGNLQQQALNAYWKKEDELGVMPNGVKFMRMLECLVLLRVVDSYWMTHIDAMADLRDSAFLQAYGGKKPIDEYKREGYEMFEAMTEDIRHTVVEMMYTAQVQKTVVIERKPA